MHKALVHGLHRLAFSERQKGNRTRAIGISLIATGILTSPNPLIAIPLISVGIRKLFR